MSLTPEQIKNYADKITVLQSEIADREEAVKNLKAKLAENLPEDEHFVGDYKITVYTSKAFNAKLAEEVLTPAQWEAISVPARATTAALAKKVLSEEDFARTQKVSTNGTSVKVELREEYWSSTLL